MMRIQKNDGTKFKLSLLALASVFMLSACSEQSDSAQQQQEQSAQDDQELSSDALNPVAMEGAELEGGNQQVSEEKLAELRQQIRDIVKPAQASNLSQCKLVGLGSKPCGGPERYLMYSTATTDETKLLPVVEQYNRMHELLNEKQGMVSTCEVIPEPGIIINGGVCAPAESATQ